MDGLVVISQVFQPLFLITAEDVFYLMEKFKDRDLSTLFLVILCDINFFS